MKANFATLVLGLAALGTLIVRYGPTGPWTFMRLGGAVLAASSGILLIVARLQLGSSFSIQPSARVLVTSGIYSRMRHPIYVFSTLLLAGVALYFSQPWLLLGILLLLVPIQIYRARKEEMVLQDAFGETYAAYRDRTRL